MDIDPEDGETRYNYAVALESAMKLTEAIEQYREAKRLGITEVDGNLRNAMAKLVLVGAKLNNTSS